MSMRVSEETLRATTACRKDCACLKGEGSDMCKAEDCVGGKVLFVDCPKGRQCPYKGHFGNGHFCCCPTRNEIYQKYKV